MKFYDRKEAGKLLANNLLDYKNLANTYVIALPRGGVPVAYEVSKKLHLPLDILVVRKIGMPFNPEFAVGAIASGDILVWNDVPIYHGYEIEQVLKEEQDELHRRENLYRGGRPYPDLQDKTVILVDDGIATGTTVEAAIKALNKMGIGKLILAVPVAADDTLKKLTSMVSEVHCLLAPKDFNAVGLWYQCFDPTSDQEVIDALG